LTHYYYSKIEDVDFATVFNCFRWSGDQQRPGNPVVSTNGKYMAFQVAKTTDPTGVGYGILQYEFKK